MSSKREMVLRGGGALCVTIETRLKYWSFYEKDNKYPVGLRSGGARGDFRNKCTRNRAD